MICSSLDLMATLASTSYPGLSWVLPTLRYTQFAISHGPDGSMLARRSKRVTEAYQRTKRACLAAASGLLVDIRGRESAMRSLPVLMDPPSLMKDEEQINEASKGFRAVLKNVKCLEGKGSAPGSDENPAVVFVLGPSRVNFVMKILSLPDRSTLGVLRFRLGVSALILSLDEALPEGLLPPEPDFEHVGRDLLASISGRKGGKGEWKQGIEIGLVGVQHKSLRKPPHLSFWSTARTRLLLDD